MLYMKTFENFDQNIDGDEETEENFDKPDTFVLFVLSDDGDFSAEVRDESGQTICKVDQSFLDNGIMQQESDLTGLRTYLVDKKKIRQQDLLTQEGTQELGHSGTNSASVQVGTI